MAATTAITTVTVEPILYRLDRLDNMVINLNPPARRILYSFMLFYNILIFRLPAETTGGD